jgi:hypothetical protein
MTMNAYRFADLPNKPAVVASSVTLLVSAWFLVAAGAILTDPASPYTMRAQHQSAQAPQHAMADASLEPMIVEGHRVADVRLATLIVEGHREADVQLATLVVEGRRSADIRFATLTVEARRSSARSI